MLFQLPTTVRVMLFQLPSTVPVMLFQLPSTVRVMLFQLPSTVRVMLFQLPSTVPVMLFQLPSTVRVMLFQLPSTVRVMLFQLPSTVRVTLFQLPSTVCVMLFQLPSTVRVTLFQLPSTVLVMLFQLPSIVRVMLFQLPSTVPVMLFKLPSTVRVMLFQLPSTVWVMLFQLPSTVPVMLFWTSWLLSFPCLVHVLGLLLECEAYIVCECAAASVMLCVAERTPTPDLKKATTFTTSSHKPLPLDRQPGAFQSTQRPLPPTPADSKLSEKPIGELRTGHFLRREEVMWDSRFSWCWWWRFKSSGMSRCVCPRRLESWGNDSFVMCHWLEECARKSLVHLLFWSYWDYSCWVCINIPSNVSWRFWPLGCGSVLLGDILKECSTFIVQYQQPWTQSHPRWCESSSRLVWEAQILHECNLCTTIAVTLLLLCCSCRVTQNLTAAVVSQRETQTSRGDAAQRLVLGPSYCRHLPYLSNGGWEGSNKVTQFLNSYLLSIEDCKTWRESACIWINTVNGLDMYIALRGMMGSSSGKCWCEKSKTHGRTALKCIFEGKSVVKLVGMA